MLVYPIDIQIYDQVSILRSKSKVKLHRVVLLGFGLKERKIALKRVKLLTDLEFLKQCRDVKNIEMVMSG